MLKQISLFTMLLFLAWTLSCQLEKKGGSENDSSSTLKEMQDSNKGMGGNSQKPEPKIQAFFNKSAHTFKAGKFDTANHSTNLEDLMIGYINRAAKNISLATYEINLDKIVAALVERAALGVEVRVIADAKFPGDEGHVDRYDKMRVCLERMYLGKDLKRGTSDDIHIFSDAPIFAVEDSSLRMSMGLPDLSTLPDKKTLKISRDSVSGYLIAEGEQKEDGSYYKGGEQMHNKFLVVDEKYVFTGSWNFTVTGLYGSEENMKNGILDGNQQHVVVLNSPELAKIYTEEFNEMWGSASLIPDSKLANYHNRKSDNTEHIVDIGGKKVEVYFSSGDSAMQKVVETVKTGADSSLDFSIFAFSRQDLTNELKFKWEGSYEDNQGSLTGFKLRGLFDSNFWNQWWSASVDMWGVTRTPPFADTENQNIRWANQAPICKDGESRKLHSKSMIIDVNTNSDPTVIVGSTNWSNNGDNVNDENLLIIHDANIANQFYQEFEARYAAGICDQAPRSDASVAIN